MNPDQRSVIYEGVIVAAFRAHRSATDRAFAASQSSRKRLDPSGFNPIAQERDQ